MPSLWLNLSSDYACDHKGHRVAYAPATIDADVFGVVEAHSVGILSPRVYIVTLDISINLLRRIEVIATCHNPPMSKSSSTRQDKKPTRMSEL